MYDDDDDIRVCARFVRGAMLCCAQRSECAMFGEWFGICLYVALALGVLGGLVCRVVVVARGACVCVQNGCQHCDEHHTLTYKCAECGKRACSNPKINHEKLVFYKRTRRARMSCEKLSVNRFYYYDYYTSYGCVCVCGLLLVL